MVKLDTSVVSTRNLAELEKLIIERRIKITSPLVSFWDNKNAFQQLQDIQDEILEYAKLNYYYQLDLINPDESSEDIFFWNHNFIKLWIIGTNTSDIGRNITFFFATKSNTDEIVTYNLVEETSDPLFYRMNTPQKIKFLMDKGLIPDITEELIISSVNSNPTIGSWAQSWVEKELDNTELLITPSTDLFKFNESIIRAKRYNFEEMLSTIDNKQFTIEFDECLHAYNNQKWFICAAGLGGVLEHLLYLILEKNNLIDKQFPDNATYQDYIGYMSRAPLSIKKREKTMIKNIFNIRNSVSHFNQGFTSKSQCSYLMNGIKDIFDNYYVKEFNLDSKD